MQICRWINIALGLKSAFVLGNIGLEIEKDATPALCE